MVEKAKKTKKGRKHGRNAIYCKVYLLSHRREVNKLRRLRKHILRFPNDFVAKAAADRCRIITGMK